MHEVWYLPSGTVGSAIFTHYLFAPVASARKKDDMKCPGKEYQSTNVLTCPMHPLAYEIECNCRADHASKIIEPELGRGHSNACEASYFHRFPQVSSKGHWTTASPLPSLNKFCTNPHTCTANVVQSTTGNWISLSRWASLCLIEGMFDVTIT